MAGECIVICAVTDEYSCAGMADVTELDGQLEAQAAALDVFLSYISPIQRIDMSVCRMKMRCAWDRSMTVVVLLCDQDNSDYLTNLQRLAISVFNKQTSHKHVKAPKGFFVTS